MPIQANYNPRDPVGPKGHFNEDGSFTYPDGGVATLAELNAERASRGMAPIDPTERSPNRAWSTVGVTDPLGNIYEEQPAFGGNAPQLSSKAPGATLDASKADAERARLAPLLASLQQQAATGGGAWEAALKTATEKARGSAEAIGQSTPGTDYGSALRNIGNAQSSVAQRAVGQENILREKAKADATKQMATLLGAQGAQDITQAESAADVAAGLRGQQVNARLKTLQNQADLEARRRKTEENTWSGIGQGAMTIATHASRGGEVPGRAPVFGDDERNDTVPAKLSPGEIVIPRSHAGSPEDAAAFVRALRSKQQHMAEGGDVKPLLGVGGYEAPSIEGGGLLNTAPYEQNRAQSDVLLKQLAQRAGNAPSPIATQEQQNATDATIAQAMQAAQRQRGVGAAGVTGAAAEGLSTSAGRAGTTTAETQSEAQRAMGAATLGQRDRELAMARAIQAAAWRNSLFNAGLTLEEAAAQQKAAAENEARTQRYLSGAGQGASALAGAWGKGDKDSNSYAGRGSPSDLSRGNEKWAGGVIKDTRAEDFVAALKRRKSA